MTPEEQLQTVLAEADRPISPDPNEALRFSRLRLMSRSAAHYAYAATETTSAMSIGSAAHGMILGCAQRIIPYPGATRRGKEWEAFAKDNADAMIVSRGEFSVAERITKSVHANHDAMRVLDGIRETTLWWKQIGRQCRGTPDVRGDGFITELKTGETADPRAFPWKMRRFCYHGQLAFYSDGALLSGLDEPQAHYVVAVEAAAPHVVTVFRLTPKAIEQGRRLVRLWFERLLACEAANEWPAYAQSIVDLDVPEEELEVLDAETVAAAEPDWAKAAF